LLYLETQCVFELLLAYYFFSTSVIGLLRVGEDYRLLKTITASLSTVSCTIDVNCVQLYLHHQRNSLILLLWTFWCGLVLWWKV